MKIIIHWDRVLGLLIAIVVVFIAIICFKVLNQSNGSDHQDIGQCDMNEAQKIIDNLVSFLKPVFDSEIFIFCKL
jgi:hypothetical protein